MNTITADKLPLLLRRAQVREITGLSDEALSKIVAAEVLKPVYLVWEVIGTEGKVLFSAQEFKARAHAGANEGTMIRPVGQAWFRRDDVLRLTDEARHE